MYHLPAGSIKVLSALDDDQVGRRVDTPGQSGCGHQDLDLACHKEGLRDGPVALAETSMVESNAELQGMPEIGLLQYPFHMLQATPSYSIKLESSSRKDGFVACAA